MSPTSSSGSDDWQLVAHVFDVKPGQVVMLENCRVNKGEKKNDETLARKMAHEVKNSLTPIRLTVEEM